MERIDTRHCRGEVVDHQVVGNALEEGPGCLQPLDHVHGLLAEGRPDEAVPRVGQDDDQRPNHPAATRLRVLHQTQTAEVHLRHLTGCALSHPDRRRTPPPPAPTLDEPPQRRVRDPAAPVRKQLLDAGHLQPVGGQPLVDLLGPGGEHLAGRRLNPPGACNTHPRQAGQLIFTRSRAVTRQTRLHRRIDVPADCRARQPRTGCYLPLAHPRLPAAYHFCYLHPRHLPVRHRCSLHPRCSNGRQSGAQGGQPPE